MKCFPRLSSKHGSKDSLLPLSQWLYQGPASCPLSQPDYISQATLVSTCIEQGCHLSRGLWRSPRKNCFWWVLQIPGFYWGAIPALASVHHPKDVGYSVEGFLSVIRVLCLLIMQSKRNTCICDSWCLCVPLYWYNQCYGKVLLA